MIAENPFTDAYLGDTGDGDLVRDAVNGDATALEALVLRHQAWVYNVAVRMVWDPTEAEDVTQEVMIKAVTKLSTFAGKSAFRTWLYRITANHVLNMKRRSSEPESLSFSEFGRGLNDAPDLDLPDASSIPVDTSVLLEEAKLGCLAGMLLCLDRRQRLVYVLAEIFGASAEVGAEILELSPANFRQILSRARQDLFRFMNDQCGLVNPDNPCRCAKKTKTFIDEGYVDPHNIRFAHSHARQMKELSHSALAVLTENAEQHERRLHLDSRLLDPPDIARLLQNILANPDVRKSLRLS